MNSLSPKNCPHTMGGAMLRYSSRCSSPSGKGRLAMVG